nr:unnamed protein product [Digitaria exilis]
MAARVAMLLQLPWWSAAAVLIVLAAAAMEVEAGGGGDGSGERQALMAVKAGFGNAANALVDWDGGRDHCAWRGVSCDSASFAVVGLNLSNLNLGGEISPAIGELKSLQFVDLKLNKLTGQIPDEIGDCVSLKYLDLSGNLLYGDIPFSISKLKQLEDLILKNNQLTGPIPSTLSQIPNLKTLDLAQNKLTGDIPRLIYWNEVLQYLGLRGNSLTGTLSSDMCQLTGLWYFDVRGNNLTGTIPEGIGNCTSFEILDISYNQISGEIPYNIGYLQVATLSLQGNRLTGRIPEVIGLMQALAVLDLSENELVGPIPPILGNLSYTGKLYLHGNKLTGQIPPELGNMSKLSYLNLANNNLEGHIPANISSCSALNKFNVYGNRLNGSIPGGFQKLESLTYLNLSSNNFKGQIPSELGHIVNLDTLDLSYNEFSGTLPPTIGDLEHLLELILNNNNLVGEIPAQLANCFSLITLNLSYNNFSGHVPSAKNFTKFPMDSFVGNPMLHVYCQDSSCGHSHGTKVNISRTAVACIILGFIILLCIMLLAIYKTNKPLPPEKGSDKPVQGPPKLVVLQMDMASHTYEEIMRLTENFSEKYIIGYGASSTVYKCDLKSGKAIAVKRLYSQYNHSLREFETELETIGSIRHRNLVSLHGFSLSPHGNLLFYDYMENGSLWDLLHGPSKKVKLDWDTRLKIAILSKADDNTVMEAVDSEVSVTCTDMNLVRKAFQLALLCTKRHPVDRPTMHEVARVLLSLLPASAVKPPTTKGTAGDYTRFLATTTADMKHDVSDDIGDNSSSDEQWFVRFGEVISKHTMS